MEKNTFTLMFLVLLGYLISVNFASPSPYYLNWFNISNINWNYTQTAYVNGNIIAFGNKIPSFYAIIGIPVSNVQTLLIQAFQGSTYIGNLWYMPLSYANGKSYILIPKNLNNQTYTNLTINFNPAWLTSQTLTATCTATNGSNCNLKNPPVSQIKFILPSYITSNGITYRNYSNLQGYWDFIYQGNNLNLSYYPDNYNHFSITYNGISEKITDYGLIGSQSLTTPIYPSVIANTIFQMQNAIEIEISNYNPQFLSYNAGIYENQSKFYNASTSLSTYTSFNFNPNRFNASYTGVAIMLPLFTTQYKNTSIYSNAKPQNPYTNNSISTGVFYQYAIPIHINSWINSTNFGYINSAGVQILKFNSGFAEITIPYYAQMNTQNGNCTGLTLVANQSYMGAIPFAIISCNPSTQTITLMAKNITTNGYLWNNGYVLFGSSSNTSIANSDNQNLLINNYTIYGNLNNSVKTFYPASQRYIKFAYPPNLYTMWGGYFTQYGYYSGLGETLFFFVKNNREYLETQIPNYPPNYWGNVSTANVSLIGFLNGNNNGYNNYYSKNLYGFANPSQSQIVLNNETKTITDSIGGFRSPFLNLSQNIAYVYAPMTTNYTLGAVQGNPFLIQNSGGLSPLPSAILPKNFYNQTFGSKGNQTIAVNFTFNYSTISNLNSNPKTNTIITIFNSIQMPKWFYIIFGITIMIIIVAILYSEKSPIILPIGIILIWIIGIVQFTFYEVALIVSILLLAGYTLKEMG